MRRFFVGMALFTLAAVTPLAAWGGDREIADQILTKLKTQRDAGELKGFTLDLKVEEGKVLFRGRVSDDRQRTAVLAAAQGIEGVRGVVDEIAVNGAQPASAAGQAPQLPVKVPAATPASAPAPAVATTSESAEEGGFSFRKALAAARREAANMGSVVPAAAALAPAHPTDQDVTEAVVTALGDAQRSGKLRNFGIDVSCNDGEVVLRGQAASDEQRRTIVEMARRAPGVRNVIDDIQVNRAPRHLTPVEVQPVSGGMPYLGGQGPVNPAPPMAVQPQGAVGMGAQGPMAQTAPYRAGQQGLPQPFAPASMGHGVKPGGVVAHEGVHAGMPMAAGPVPMAYGAARYDKPHLPNYAWPGYAAYPNYAAVTYPQQYSPSAWPYIGPFYPYPQVPLGWRKVCLEWDDGWWHLDFTSKK